jgi:hypothetical protein
MAPGYPIRVYIDPGARKGWRNALKLVVVRHLSIGDTDEKLRMFGFMVSPAVISEAEQLGGDPDDLGRWLATVERELGVGDLEAIAEAGTRA